jgi:hypothetical protein
MSDSENLIPILAFTNVSGKRKMNPLTTDNDFEDPVNIGTEKFESNEMDD